MYQPLTKTPNLLPSTADFLWNRRNKALRLSMNMKHIETVLSFPSVTQTVPNITLWCEMVILQNANGLLSTVCNVVLSHSYKGSARLGPKGSFCKSDPATAVNSTTLCSHVFPIAFLTTILGLFFGTSKGLVRENNCTENNQRGKSKMKGK